jgi:uncharacterized YigZ family protein
MDHYFTIERESVAEFKDRGSRFIAFAFPVSDTDSFKKKLQELKKEHGKAVHHCFAYRLGFTGHQFRANDDGEPSGSAGKPILGQIDSKKLTNAGIIVVRYFGGTLLGVPGLINAYKTSASLALQTVPIIQKPVLQEYDLQFDYNQLNVIMLLVKGCNAVMVQQDLGLFPNIRIMVPKNREDELLFKISELRNVEMRKIL